MLRLVRRAVPVLFVVAIVLCAIGLTIGFRLAPADVGRGELFRMAYVHVPATWVALLLYAAVVICAFVQLTAGARGASMALEAIAPTAAMFALLALWTGSLWSKAAADVWWDWDARRLADLALLVFAAGCVMVREAMGEGRTADLASAVLALAGGVIILILLRAISLVPQVGEPASHAVGRDVAVFAALACVAAGFVAYAAAASLVRLRCVILERDRGCDWVRDWGGR